MDHAIVTLFLLIIYIGLLSKCDPIDGCWTDFN